MIFGLFGNSQGKSLLKETIRTLEKADELSEKDKKIVAKYVFSETIKHHYSIIPHNFILRMKVINVAKVIYALIRPIIES